MSALEAVAASQAMQVLGGNGATGDFLSHVLIIPTTTSPGAVTLYDGGSNAAYVLFDGGASSVSNLAPFAVPVMQNSEKGSWRITTGANVRAVAVGQFSG